MKLVSMTDYVLSHKETQKSNMSFWQIIKYAEFLKQPLELWMFVPCDQEGKPMKSVWDMGFMGSQEMQYEFYKQAYKRAQDRVLFKGWEYAKDDFLLKKLDNGEELQICLIDYTFHQQGSLGSGMGNIGETIESLSMCSLDIELNQVI